ncbi:uncharacterized protein DNG_03957 [Cephalotrichum gorgonifer]|uniref:LysM domain-containing protein n=1 Tax=Cephalotrichum gorgonifer TaxID=2041049 RepID=A0AAE8MXV8_9PEZI|nr:uncharacterized protein DNG_03957 [Cephalotrichum gorgonifer]
MRPLINLPHSIIALLFIIPRLAAADPDDDPRCSPYTWENSEPGDPSPTAWPARPEQTRTFKIGRPEKAGDINCRFGEDTYETVNSGTCAELANMYHITLEKFMMLNPILDADCGNIQPYTEYCVAGFIEPLRAYDGLCGPPHNGATCIGVDHGQCCNSETWTCGETSEDCARGTCYEGVCWGHKVFATDGKCGPKHGNRQCAGKWGECCSFKGECGSDKEHCGVGTCLFGACEEPLRPKIRRPECTIWPGVLTEDGINVMEDRLACMADCHSAWEERSKKDRANTLGDRAVCILRCPDVDPDNHLGRPF